MPEPALPSRRKWSIAHRGASAYAPEHTIEAYRLAIEQTTDYIEPDLQVTADGVLVCLHDVTLERTTNAPDVFPDRYREEQAEAGPVRRWYVGDLSLDEVRTLDAGSWFGDRFRGARVPTFAEALRLARGKVGVFPETKAPDLYAALGFSMEDLLLEDLARERFGEEAGPDPVVVQSFATESLRRMRERAPGIPRILLLEGAEAPSVLDDLPRIHELARGIGPSKELLHTDPGIVARAHAEGLLVVPWTFRSDRPGFFRSVAEEMYYYLNHLDVDGLFTNNPDLFPR